jgi:hypothetical protein
MPHAQCDIDKLTEKLTKHPIGRSWYLYNIVAFQLEDGFWLILKNRYGERETVISREEFRVWVLMYDRILALDTSSIVLGQIEESP